MTRPRVTASIVSPPKPPERRERIRHTRNSLQSVPSPSFDSGVTDGRGERLLADPPDGGGIETNDPRARAEVVGSAKSGEAQNATETM